MLKQSEQQQHRRATPANPKTTKELQTFFRRSAKQNDYMKNLSHVVDTYRAKKNIDDKNIYFKDVKMTQQVSKKEYFANKKVCGHKLDIKMAAQMISNLNLTFEEKQLFGNFMNSPGNFRAKTYYGNLKEKTSEKQFTNVLNGTYKHLRIDDPQNMRRKLDQYISAIEKYKIYPGFNQKIFDQFKEIITTLENKFENGMAYKENRNIEKNQQLKQKLPEQKQKTQQNTKNHQQKPQSAKPHSNQQAQKERPIHTNEKFMSNNEAQDKGWKGPIIPRVTRQPAQKIFSGGVRVNVENRPIHDNGKFMSYHEAQSKGWINNIISKKKPQIQTDDISKSKPTHIGFVLKKGSNSNNSEIKINAIGRPIYNNGRLMSFKDAMANESYRNREASLINNNFMSTHQKAFVHDYGMGMGMGVGGGGGGVERASSAVRVNAIGRPIYDNGRFMSYKDAREKGWEG